MNVNSGAIQKFPKFEFCARMFMSTSKYRYVSPHTPFLNQCDKRQTFGDNSLGQTQTYDWYQRLKNGRTSTDDDDHSGWP
jgi:hypothetical protein